MLSIKTLDVWLDAMRYLLLADRDALVVLPETISGKFVTVSVETFFSVISVKYAL